MSKIFLYGALTLFAAIGCAAAFKKKSNPSSVHTVSVDGSASTHHLVDVHDTPKKPRSFSPEASQKVIPNLDLPNIDRIFQLFTTTGSKLPIVETLKYSTSVPWMSGRPAWISDYAVFYNTSKHFIARSLNGRPDYLSQKVSSGAEFNVFKKDVKIEFHLVVDVTRLKLAFYYYDLLTSERVLLKTYKVGLGRIDASKASGTLTPLGSFSLGDKIAVYKQGVTGLFHDQKTEMMRVFGTRWIPFDQEVGNASESGKGYGINGAPWRVDPTTGQLEENRDVVGQYESDGCIRMYLEDMEELFSIVVTKPAFVHIVKNFQDVALPGKEVAAPSR